jgi:regulator of sigma E protease
MLGGVTVNFILAGIIYIFLAFGYGDIDIKADSIKDGYWIENPLLLDFGFKTGDKILAINENKIVNYSDLKKHILEAQVVTIERDGATEEIKLPEDFLGQLSGSKSKSFFELRYPFIVGRVADSSLNKSVDLKKNDVILTINGSPLKYFDQVGPVLESLKNQSVQVELLRGDKTITRELKVDDKGKLGIYPGGTLSDIERLNYYDIIKKEYGFGESIGVGLTRFKDKIGDYWTQLKLIFSPSTGAYKGVGGFKAIFDIFPDTWSWPDFWNLTAFLSIMLGVLNLLPIPALDGGHVMFLLYEMISGRKPSDKFLEYAQMVGFFILIALVLFANGNDIFKAIFN